MSVGRGSFQVSDGWFVTKRVKPPERECECVCEEIVIRIIMTIAAPSRCNASI